jgi:FkbM family methyltransferase
VSVKYRLGQRLPKELRDGLTLDRFPLRASLAYAYFEKRRCQGQHPLRLPEATLWFEPSSVIDGRLLRSIFIRNEYACDFRDRLVLDIGAHKGYFAAYAFLHGARAVVSFEPASANFALLSRSAGSSSWDWSAERAAIGPVAGTATINISSESWAHSIGDIPSGAVVGNEVVAMLPLADVIAAHPDPHLIVKLDIEGMEEEVIPATSPEVWAGVEQVCIEFHPAERASRFERYFSDLGFQLERRDPTSTFTRVRG